MSHKPGSSDLSNISHYVNVCLIATIMFENVFPPCEVRGAIGSCGIGLVPTVCHPTSKAGLKDFAPLTPYIHSNIISAIVTLSVTFSRQNDRTNFDEF